MANASVQKNYKNRLQEYTQKRGLPLPVYDTVNEGPDHLPKFKCRVTVNGVRYESTPGNTHKKASEQSAAQAAVEDLIKNSAHHFEETLGKNLLLELLVRLGRATKFTFSTTMIGAAHSPIFTSILEADGVSYVGDAAKSKKEAEEKAAFVAFQEIKAQIGEPCSKSGSKGNSELEQPIEECKDTKFEVNTMTNSGTPKNEFLVGNNSELAETALITLNVENSHAVEMGSGNSNANEVSSACGTLPHKQLEQETLLVQHASLKTKGEDVVQHQEHGPNETEEKQQGVSEVNLTESMNKRSRNEPENCEQTGKKKKKYKKKKDKSINPSGTSTGN